MLQSPSKEVQKLKHNVLDKIKTPRSKATRSDLDNIALPINNHNYKLMLTNEVNAVADKKIMSKEVSNNSICNSYRFLVNYG